MMATKQVTEKKLVLPSSEHTATVIFLHGAGDTGPGVKSWIDNTLEEEFRFPHIKLIYPSALPKPYMGSRSCTVWFDWEKLHPNSKEWSEDVVKASADSVIEIIEDEAKLGIADDRIIVGGLSQGGCLTFSVGCRYRKSLKGVFALSSFLTHQSPVYESLKQNNDPIPPLFQSHGMMDHLICYDWGKATHDKLCELGVKGQFYTYPELGHALERDELLYLKEWILELLPQVCTVVSS